MKKDEKVMVSVCMITYNHEQYIAQAIEGVLMQKTNFTIELIIGEDGSTDNTAGIIKEYQQKYPDIIKAHFNSPNLGMMPNFYNIIGTSSGKYIAICEGDDFWTDQFKLQKQVDFLEANPDYALVHTDFDECFESNSGERQSVRNRIKDRIKSGNVFFELLTANFIGTLTCCCRADVFKSLDTDSKDFIIDYWYWLKIAENHKIMYLDCCTATYRIHGTSAIAQTGFVVSRGFLVQYNILLEFLEKNKFNSLSKSDKKVVVWSFFRIIKYKTTPIKNKLKSMYYIINNPTRLLILAKLLMEKFF